MSEQHEDEMRWVAEQVVEVIEQAREQLEREGPPLPAHRIQELADHMDVYEPGTPEWYDAFRALGLTHPELWAVTFEIDDRDERRSGSRMDEAGGGS